MLPSDFIKRVQTQLGEEFDSFLQSYEQSNIRALRVNTLKGTVDDFIHKNPWGIENEDRVFSCSNGFYFDCDEIGKHPYHASGVYYIQEASAMAPVTELDIREGDIVLDLCASPGGKSTQIAAMLNNTGFLLCNEINSKRAMNLSENIERMGVANALVTSEDPSKLSEHFEGCFNKILVDAPCSGEGMFRKNPEAIEQWSLENVTMCAERQKYILNEASKMLCYGGRLVYSTCTFAPEEDEECIEAFINEHPEFRLIKTDKFWPHKVKGEGHFEAVMEKVSPNPNATAVVSIPQNGYEKLKTIKDVPEFEAFAADTLNCDITKIYRSREAGFLRFGDEIYLLPEGFPNMKGLKVLRSGLHLGTLKKNRFEPSHSLALFLHPEDVKNVCNVDKDIAQQYIKGMTINYEGDKGWYLITIDGYSLGFGKLAQGVMKNHYPKGLRK